MFSRLVAWYVWTPQLRLHMAEWRSYMTDRPIDCGKKWNIKTHLFSKEPWESKELWEFHMFWNNIEIWSNLLYVYVIVTCFTTYMYIYIYALSVSRTCDPVKNMSIFRMPPHIHTTLAPISPLESGHCGCGGWTQLMNPPTCNGKAQYIDFPCFPFFGGKKTNNLDAGYMCRSPQKNKLNVSFVASYMFVNIDVFIKKNNVLS